MGRTIPSFRIALAQEESAWKGFRDALDSSGRRCLDRAFDISRLYVAACMLSCRPVRIQPILMAVVFHHYKVLHDIGGKR